MSSLVSPAKPLNLTERFLDANLSQGRADKTALIVERPDREAERFTYAEVSARASQLGHELGALSLGMEDRIFIVLDDGIEWASAFFGALKIGATVMFLPTTVTAEELAFYLADSRAKGVITNREVAERLPSTRPHLTAVLVVDDEATIARMGQHPGTLPTAPTTEDDFSIWLYSSGSTGAPKAAVHRAFDFLYNTERYPKEVLRQGESDITISIPKLFFGYATGSNLLFTFFYGGTAVLFPDKPTPERVLSLVEKHKATLLINVPTMIAQMADFHEKAAKEGRGFDTSSLRATVSAGEALPPEVRARFQSAFGIPILDGIGSAEMFHIFISNRFDDDPIPGSLGRLVEGYQARIVGEDGQEVGPGEIGTLWVGGQSAAAFYWQRHERSREVLRGGWVVSGDLFSKDERGNFFYQGRADDMMKVGGRWVSPQEIEAALTQHEAVKEAGAAPFQKDGLVKPMAFVILREGFEKSEELSRALSDHVAKNAAPFKAPRFVEFVPTLPRGDRDKLDRKALAKMAAELAKK